MINKLFKMDSPGHVSAANCTLQLNCSTLYSTIRASHTKYGTQIPPPTHRLTTYHPRHWGFSNNNTKTTVTHEQNTRAQQSTARSCELTGSITGSYRGVHLMYSLSFWEVVRVVSELLATLKRGNMGCDDAGF